MDERFQLIERAQHGNEQALQTLVQENTPLVWSVVSRYTGRGVEAEDLFQLGSIGLIKAIRGFDIHYGTQFSTYAVPKISGELRRFLRDDGLIKVSRTTKSLAYRIAQMREEMVQATGREPTVQELAERLDLPPEEIAASENAMLPTDYLQRPLGEDGSTLEQMLPDSNSEETFFDRLALREAMEKLEPREKKLLLLRYYRGYTQQQCASALGVSQVQISRLERRILSKLRSWMDDSEK
ncbi:MAG: sigma-70 family RNA polymerase sigma factor [Butyricicoccus sp.]